MALHRFRYEVEGVDKEDVELQLDNAFLEFAKAAHAIADEIENFECTDERIGPMQRNGVPLMYGRRVFRVVKKKEVNANA